MINFFRRLRLDALSRKRFPKYIAYATGEIVLVVIGILIALSINTWNEDRKDKASEQDIYCKLLADFELDLQNIEKLTAESDEKIIVAKKLLLELPEMSKDINYLMNNYIQALRTNAFTPSKVTITDITSSGKLSLLTNETLKNTLIRYYAELDNLLFQLSINRDKSIEKAFAYEDDLTVGFQYADYAKITLGPEVMATFPEANWPYDNTSKIYKQFQNDLFFFVAMSHREKQHFQNIKKEMRPTYQQLKELCK
jgi:hypothetical protein